MTGGTIGRNAVFYKLVIMVIGMAISTAVMLNRIGKSRLMAELAGNCLVLVHQREFSLIVVKIYHALHRVKGVFAVALAAILAEFVLVRISMAACAICIRNPRELLHLFSFNRLHLMALDAFDGGVLAGKLEFSPVMVEI